LPLRYLPVNHIEGGDITKYKTSAFEIVKELFYEGDKRIFIEEMSCPSLTLSASYYS
jgi:hypothetical protein